MVLKSLESSLQGPLVPKMTDCLVVRLYKSRANPGNRVYQTRSAVEMDVTRLSFSTHENAEGTLAFQHSRQDPQRNSTTQTITVASHCVLMWAES
jgi:hypothetical protein